MRLICFYGGWCIEHGISLEVVPLRECTGGERDTPHAHFNWAWAVLSHHHNLGGGGGGGAHLVSAEDI